jgi:hypothetical protein
VFPLPSGINIIKVSPIGHSPSGINFTVNTSLDTFTSPVNEPSIVEHFNLWMVAVVQFQIVDHSVVDIGIVRKM